MTDPVFLDVEDVLLTAEPAFVDGNKRTGLLAALVFLDLNGIAIDGRAGGLRFPGAFG